MKHVAFISSVPNYDLFNRKSAIDSILCSILLSLKDDFKITINGEEIEKLYGDFLNRKANNAPINALSTSHPLSRMIPDWLREKMKIRRQKRFNNSLYSKLKLLKPDLVFELLQRGSDVGAKLATNNSCPYLIYYDSPITIQFEEIFCKPSPIFYVRKEIESINCADGILSYSKPVIEYIKNNFDCKKNLIFFKYQTLDYTRLTAGKLQQNIIPVIGFIGSFMTWHRVMELVHTYEKIRYRGFEAKLLLIGAGKEFDAVTQRVNNSAFSKDIEMTGFIDGSELNSFKSKIDIGVMPGSNWYGIPTKVFEYGAFGIASVAPATPTIKDIFVDKKEILLFDLENEDSMEETLVKLLSDEEFRIEIAKNLKQRIVSEYSISNARLCYMNMFSQFIS